MHSVLEATGEVSEVALCVVGRAGGQGAAAAVCPHCVTHCTVTVVPGH